MDRRGYPHSQWSRSSQPPPNWNHHQPSHTLPLRSRPPAFPYEHLGHPYQPIPLFYSNGNNGFVLGGDGYYYGSPVRASTRPVRRTQQHNTVFRHRPQGFINHRSHHSSHGISPGVSNRHIPIPKEGSWGMRANYDRSQTTTFLRPRHQLPPAATAARKPPPQNLKQSPCLSMKTPPSGPHNPHAAVFQPASACRNETAPAAHRRVQPPPGRFGYKHHTTTAVEKEHDLWNSSYAALSQHEHPMDRPSPQPRTKNVTAVRGGVNHSWDTRYEKDSVVTATLVSSPPRTGIAKQSMTNHAGWEASRIVKIPQKPAGTLPFQFQKSGAISKSEEPVAVVPTAGRSGEPFKRTVPDLGSTTVVASDATEPAALSTSATFSPHLLELAEPFAAESVEVPKSKSQKKRDRHRKTNWNLPEEAEVGGTCAAKEREPNTAGAPPAEDTKGSSFRFGAVASNLTSGAAQGIPFQSDPFVVSLLQASNVQSVPGSVQARTDSLSSVSSLMTGSVWHTEAVHGPPEPTVTTFLRPPGNSFVATLPSILSTGPPSAVTSSTTALVQVWGTNPIIVQPIRSPWLAATFGSASTLILAVEVTGMFPVYLSNKKKAFAPSLWGLRAHFCLGNPIRSSLRKPRKHLSKDKRDRKKRKLAAAVDSILDTTEKSKTIIAMKIATIIDAMLDTSEKKERIFEVVATRTRQMTSLTPTLEETKNNNEMGKSRESEPWSGSSPVETAWTGKSAAPKKETSKANSSFLCQFREEGTSSMRRNAVKRTGRSECTLANIGSSAAPPPALHLFPKSNNKKPLMFGSKCAAKESEPGLDACGTNKKESMVFPINGTCGTEAALMLERKQTNSEPISSLKPLHGMSSLQQAAFQGTAGAVDLLAPRTASFQTTQAKVPATTSKFPVYVSSLQQAINQSTAGGVSTYYSDPSSSTSTGAFESVSRSSVLDINAPLLEEGTSRPRKASIYSLRASSTAAIAERQYTAALTIRKAWRMYSLPARLQGRFPLIVPKKRHRRSKAKRDRCKRQAAANTIIKAWRAYSLLARLLGHFPLIRSSSELSKDAAALSIWETRGLPLVLPKKRHRPGKKQRDRLEKRTTATAVALAVKTKNQHEVATLSTHTVGLRLPLVLPKARHRPGKIQPDKINIRVEAAAASGPPLPHRNPSKTTSNATAEPGHGGVVLLAGIEELVSLAGKQRNTTAGNEAQQKVNFTGNLKIGLPKDTNDNAELLQGMHIISAAPAEGLTSGTASDLGMQLQILAPPGFVKQNSLNVTNPTCGFMQSMHGEYPGNQGKQFQVVSPPRLKKQNVSKVVARTAATTASTHAYAAVSGVLDTEMLKHNRWHHRTNQHSEDGAEHIGKTTLANRCLNMWHDGFDAPGGMVFTHETRLREELTTLLDSIDG